MFHLGRSQWRQKRRGKKQQLGKGQEKRVKTMNINELQQVPYWALCAAAGLSSHALR